MVSKASSLVGLGAFLFFSLSVLPKPNGQPFEFLQHLQGCHKGYTLKGVHQLKQYLEQFGYLHYDSHATHANDDEFDDLLESAVKTYQLNYHLKATGSLDNQTVREMMKPRCGVPDIINGTTRMRPGKKKHQHGPLSLHTVSHYAFLEGSPKWPDYKTHLTYTFRSTAEVINLQTLRPIVSRSFARWAAVSQFTFAEAQAGSDADLELGFHRLAHGDSANFDGPGGVLAHAAQPTFGLFHYDADENWGTTPNIDEFDLESITVHEIGHLLGLGHSEFPEAVMFKSIDSGTRKRELQGDDVQGIRTLYGLST